MLIELTENGGQHTPCSPSDVAMALKALADTTRLRILAVLRARGETCVCELIEECGCSPPTLSFHLSKLRGAGLITARKVGKWIFYRPDAEQLAQLCDWLGEALDTSCTPDQPQPGSASCLCAQGCLPASRDQLRERGMAAKAQGCPLTAGR